MKEEHTNTGKGKRKPLSWAAKGIPELLLSVGQQDCPRAAVVWTGVFHMADYVQNGHWQILLVAIFNCENRSTSFVLFWWCRKAWKSLGSGIYSGLLIFSGIRHTQALRISNLCFRVCTKAQGEIAKSHFKLIEFGECLFPLDIWYPISEVPITHNPSKWN